jgi:hypothetical protein
MSASTTSRSKSNLVLSQDQGRISKACAQMQDQDDAQNDDDDGPSTLVSRIISTTETARSGTSAAGQARRGALRRGRIRRVAIVAAYCPFRCASAARASCRGHYQQGAPGGRAARARMAGGDVRVASLAERRTFWAGVAFVFLLDAMALCRLLHEFITVPQTRLVSSPWSWVRAWVGCGRAWAEARAAGAARRGAARGAGAA